MLPVKTVRLLLGELLAADATVLGPMIPNEVVLVQNNFVPSEDLVMADITPADFDGAAPLAVGATPQLAGVDPITGEQIVTMKEPAGGWRWEVTGVTNLPQTIFGAALTNSDQTELLATLVFDQPITLSEVGEEINLGTVAFRIVLQPMS